MSFSSKPTKVLSFALIFALLFNVVGVPSALAAAGVPQPTAQKSKLTADIGDLPNKLPSSKIELPSKRTEYSTRYLNPDGSFTEEIFNEPQFYQDSNDKKWKKIDNTLKPSTKAVGKYENTANDYIARFAEQAGSGDLVSVEKDGKSISLVPDQANRVSGILSGSTITYPGLFADTDVRYQMQGDAVKEDLILHKYSDRNTFTFELKLNGVTPVVEKDGTITFSDTKGNKQWFLARPYMTDAIQRRQGYL